MSDYRREPRASGPGCEHWEIADGPRISRVYGRGQTQVCAACGAWRPNFGGAARRYDPWRPARTLAAAMEPDDEM